MAKKFTLAILALLLAVPALAVPVDPDSPDGIAARIYHASTQFVLDTTGRTWNLDAPGSQGWTLMGAGIPIEVSDVKDWNVWFIESVEGVHWRAVILVSDEDLVWEVYDPNPLSVVCDESQSLGSLKFMYR